jgi:2-oxoglutarate ferredoxin oxidoreductase subunit delta
MAKGTVVIQQDRCKGCALCVRACPQHVLHLASTFNARGYHFVELDECTSNCTGCGVCALVCPDVVFTVLRSPTRVKRAA